MVFQSLKKTLIFSVIAILCYGLFVSCENPFSNNLGSKVDIEPPTITVISPTSGEFLRDTVTFTGEATAYRDLRRSNGEYSDAIQVMISDQTDETRVYLPWTTIGRSITTHPSKEKTWVWTYDLNTIGFDDTLFLKMKFRVYDESADSNRKPTETIQLVYIVKNGPSTVKLGSPDHTNLENPSNETNPQALVLGENEIGGTIIDRRGVKPGYPMIKFWPEDPNDPNYGEPLGNDTDWGWAVLFLYGKDRDGKELDDPTKTVGAYANRNEMPVVNAPNFAFKLWEYYIHPTTRQIMYDRTSGDTRPLSAGYYRFRIKTSDTYFDNADMKPRPPNPEEGEEEAIGYYPVISMLEGTEAEWDNHGPSYRVLLKSSGVNPTIMMENKDVEEKLPFTPHIYLTPDSMKKIAVKKPGSPDFRLQVLVQHPNGIDKATLQYEHTSGSKRRTGYLAWDNDLPGNQGYANSANPGEGHRGSYKDGIEGNGSYFRFTESGALKDADDQTLFSPSTEPYTLIVRAVSKGEPLYGEQRYTLFLDDSGPEVSIRSVRGASNDPTDSGSTSFAYDSTTIGKLGGRIFNRQAYEVNGNIQVSIDRVANQGINLVKWVVEEDRPDYFTTDDTMLAKIKTYRETPNYNNFQFYNEITEGRMSGEIKPPSTEEDALDPDKTYNLKFNTWKDEDGENAWNGKDLWLYVIADDGMQNLGFVLQKLHVDDSADIPVLTKSKNFFSTTEPGSPITGLASLYQQYDGTSTSGNTANRNKLDDEGIDLSFKDDDGIDITKDIKVELAKINDARNLSASLNPIRVTLNAAQLGAFLNGKEYLLGAHNSKEWGGILSQKIMADALFGEGVHSKLPDGYYQLTVNLSDNKAAKVAITDRGEDDLLPGDEPVAASIREQVFFFVVKTNWPELDIENPKLETVLLNSSSVSVNFNGTVKSEVKIPRLEISFTPALEITNTNLTRVGDTNRYTVTLYGKRTLSGESYVYSDPITGFDHTDQDADGRYVYYWNIEDVNMGTGNVNSRTFAMTARDGLGFLAEENRMVEIDTTPPNVQLDQFNFGRNSDDPVIEVNGKVPVEINVYDAGGVAVEEKDDTTFLKIKWWVRLKDSSEPDWETGFSTTGGNGTGGQFKTGLFSTGEGNEITVGSGSYMAVFDTTNTALFTDGREYTLYAMAYDEADNTSGVKTLTSAFKVNQANDVPVLYDVLPLNGDTKENRNTVLNITGRVSDDDGFSSDESKTYVEIRFPYATDSDWKKVSFKPSGDEIEFTYETRDNPYFGINADGDKYYQIRVSDEPDAGPTVPGTPYGNPTGKNPDGAKKDVPGSGYIGANSKIYPSDTTYYHFLLKNNPPQVWFIASDPNPGHETVEVKDEDGTVIETKYYDASRPAYNDRAKLVADLMRGIEIQESTEVAEAYFYYKDETGHKLTLKDSYEDSVRSSRFYPVDLSSSDLTAWLTNVPFGTGKADDEGMYSFVIEAKDRAGNSSRVEWMFNVDNLGPYVEFRNVNDNADAIIAGTLEDSALPIVSGNIGSKTYIRGSFRDDISDILDTINYRFDEDPWLSPQPKLSEGYGTITGRSAQWQIEVPDTLKDGVCTLYIEAQDKAGNLSNAKYHDYGVKFILDRTAPEVSEVKDMIVIIGAEKMQLKEHERVFSAPSAYVVSGDDTLIFTLSGMVYDMFLSGLTITYPDTVSLPDGIADYDWNDSDKKWYPSESGQLRVRKADTGDYTGTGLYTRIDNDKSPSNSTANLYVWELDMKGDDLYNIISVNPGNANGSTPRQISVVAEDRAKYKSDRRDWRFYLDSAPPTVSFYNAYVAPAGGYKYYNGTSDTEFFAERAMPARIDIVGDNFTLDGFASDGTNIKEIRYLVSRSTTGVGTGDPWRYYSGTAWDASTTTNWHTMLSEDDSATNPQTTVSWSLDNTKLGSSNGYPDSLSDGLYRLELQVTDYSKATSGAGNPVTSIVEFFIDRSEPTLTAGAQKDFYRTSDLTFTVRAKDDNGIAGFAEVELRGTSITPSISVSKVSGSDTESDITITIASMDSNLDGRYTLVLTVKDRTGKSAVIGNTIDFYLDNTAPTIGLTPAGGTEAITGRQMFQGSFIKPAGTSPVKRVAFQLATFDKTGATVTGTTPSPADGETVDGELVPKVGNLSDEDLTDLGWNFADGGDPWFKVDGKQLMEIKSGLSNVNILIPNTRNLINTGYMGAGQTVGDTGVTGITFDGTAITGTNQIVHKLRIYFLAIDEAGNHRVEPVDYWVYPEGDRPKVDRIQNPSDNPADTERLFSGSFRITGTAVDNDYVQNVYFRVLLKDNAGTYNLVNFRNIPRWDTDWSAIEGAYQGDPTTGKGITIEGDEGWYMANGGGSRNVSWWAYINGDGELDPDDTSLSDIIIEVKAVDSIWDDTVGVSGAWSTSANLYSKTKETTAQVVSGKPTYSEEIVKQGASGAPRDNDGDLIENPTIAEWTSYFDTWSSALTTNVSGRASYAITVKNITPIGEIRWTRPNGQVVNLADFATTNVYNRITYGDHLSAMDGSGGYDVSTNPGIAIRAIKISDLEYRVVVDLNSKIIPYGEGGTYGTVADYYTFTLATTEKSSPIPLSSQTTVRIPIDNVPPQALYTHTSRVAGSNATFGGVAGDFGRVNGLSKVVIWFSRNTSSGEESVTWKDRATPTADFQFDSAPANMIGLERFNGLGIQFPKIPADGDATDDNISCVVINRNDTMGTSAHNGHKLGMGWATVGGELPMDWYVTLNSTQMVSGARTVHYVVYDRAGNCAYYNQKIMVMNDIPQIRGIRIGTDIRGDRDFNTTFAANAAVKGKANDEDDGVLNRIRTALGYAAVTTATPVAANDIASGISDYISIDTSRPNTSTSYNMVYDQPFNVRNNLLAIQIETNDHSSDKPRNYRFEYVSGAVEKSGAGVILGAGGIKQGRVYIINNPGSDLNKFPWGSLGATAPGDNYTKGLAFLALEDGTSIQLPLAPESYGTPSVWELNSSYYQSTGNNRTLPVNLELGDMIYGSMTGDTYNHEDGGTSAEFVYAASAFNAATGTTIVDFKPETGDFNPNGLPRSYPFPSVAKTDSDAQLPWVAHSLFIIRVFDTNTVDELFGDFALLSIRVNNDDKTVPYSQLYDLNPKTEGQDSAVSNWATALSPGNMGQNRTKGGLYNDTGGNIRNLAKSGHIEPRSGTSLTSADMGGAPNADQASIYKPVANTGAYFTVDTVSGEVILRGYAEDDQRIGSIELQFWNEANSAQIGSAIPILNYTNKGTYLIGPPAAVASNVNFTESIDLNRHRVEWAYRWNTETVPTGTVVGNINVRVVVRNVDKAYALKATNPGIPFSSAAANGTLYDVFNPNFGASGRTVNSSTSPTVATGPFLRYNEIPVHIRPYISGIVRDKDGLNTRSRQGWYMLRRGETAVVSGFNMGGNTSISLATANAAGNTSNVTATNFDLTAAQIAQTSRYRQFAVNANQTTGDGIITLTVNTTYPAVNRATILGTGGTGEPTARSRVVQPWNTERSPGTTGSNLWDDFTAVHIWLSNDTNSGTANVDNGSFRTTDNWVILNPAMSVDPTNGVLYASYNEGGVEGGTDSQTGDTVSNGAFLLTTTNDNATGNTRNNRRMYFRDPMIHSDVYRSATNTWSVTSIIGQSTGVGGGYVWRSYGGIYIHGPNGTSVQLSSGSMNSINQANNFYLAESTWYNSALYSGVTASRQTNPPSTDQFANPHIITSGTGDMHIHVSYYDTKDGSIKYRYNRNNNPTAAGTIDNATNSQANAQVAANRQAVEDIPKMWTNLDGGYDADDLMQTTYTSNQISGYTNPLPANARVVNYGNAARSVSAKGGEATAIGSYVGITAGEHNAIAVTSDGYPVVAYYNATDQILKLAVSNSVSPVLGSAWVIRDKVIPDGPYQFGTGQFVSIAIDTRTQAGVTNPTLNVIHMAAMNTNGNLVYIRGKLNTGFTTANRETFQTAGTALTDVTVHVVDSLGTVGRWCNISLDADGNPWIAYQDTGYIDSRNGVKLAYLNTTRFKKGTIVASYDADEQGEDIDRYGKSVSGWETMHVPANYKVANPLISGPGENGRIGLECYPTRNYTAGTPASKFWSAAVSYLSTDPTNKYRIAYYAK